MDELLTAKQVSEIKKVAISTVYAAMTRGDLVYVEQLGRKGVKPDICEAWKPASGGGVKRETVRRGPGRPKLP